MLSWISRQLNGWRRRNRTDPPAPAGEPQPFTKRRWEAARTDRLNKAHWQYARGQSINADLLSDQQQLWARSQYELANNPILEGVVNTYSDDIAGRNGPTLQVQCGDDVYAAALEAVWTLWFKNPDIAGKLGGADLLSLWARNLWTCGEFLAQKVTDPEPDAGPITMRLRTIAPRRLSTPVQYAGDWDVVLGVRQNHHGKPLSYFISDPLQMGAYLVETGRYTELPARDVIHRFAMVEEDQARGVPWLATALQPVADLRDFDNQVLDAARQAADMAVYWYTDHPDAPFLDVNESTDVERRMQTTGPPGWKPASFTPPQPATNYVDYRAERHREMGRPRGMPLMRVRLDSSKHTYSSARFDDVLYRTGIDKQQAWFERRTLHELLEEVRREAELYAAANPDWEHSRALRRRPAGAITYRWIWTKFPAIDLQKEMLGERLAIESGTLTYADALAAKGQDEDSVIESRRRTNDKLKAAGLPPLPTAAKPGTDVAVDLDKQQAAEDAEAAGDQPDEGADSPPPENDGSSESGSDARQAIDAEAFAAAVNAYGTAVRAGAITPQTADENHFRKLIGLPAMGTEARGAWVSDKGVRRPITLASVADTKAEIQAKTDAADQPTEP